MPNKIQYETFADMYIALEDVLGYFDQGKWGKIIFSDIFYLILKFSSIQVIHRYMNPFFVKM